MHDEAPDITAVRPTDRLYTAQFFQVFAASACFMTGAALQFHFGQYLGYLGYDVDVLGRVLAVGMLATLSIRFWIGRWIDRLGCRTTWLAGTTIVALAVGSLQFVRSLGPILLIRTVMAMAFATVMTTVAVFAALIAPPHRRAESIGIIGLSGFLGIMTGPTLGDWIFSGPSDSIVPYRVFFTASAACALAAALLMARLRLTSIGPAAAGGERPGLALIRRYWPGPVMLVGAVFSMVFCMQMAFLERLAEARGFRDIKLFFLVYAPTAIALRVAFRRIPERLGRRPTVVLGMVLMAAGLFVLSAARAQHHLLLPGLLMGAGHCFIFPSMVDLAAACFPLRYRGIGTSCILGAGDAGMLFGFVVLGESFRRFGYTATLVALATLVMITAAVFGLTAREPSVSDVEVLSHRAETSTRHD